MFASNPSENKTAKQLAVPSWDEAARRLLRAEMAKKDWRYRQLARELKKKFGLEPKLEDLTAQLTRRVNRGKFSAGFLLACLDVLGVQELQLLKVQASASEPIHPQTGTDEGNSPVSK